LKGKIMTSHPAVTITGDEELQRFHEDASGFLRRQPPQSFPVPVVPAPPGIYSRGTPGVYFAFPSVAVPLADTAAARKRWLDVLERFTEPVPGQEGWFQIRGSQEFGSGLLVVEYGALPEPLSPASESRRRKPVTFGSQFDPGNSFCLILRGQGGLRQFEELPERYRQSADCITLIPWTEIVSLHLAVASAEPTSESG
jgi:hypothetical protein